MPNKKPIKPELLKKALDAYRDDGITLEEAVRIADVSQRTMTAELKKRHMLRGRKNNGRTMIGRGWLALKPKHCFRFAMCSREWYEACDRAYKKAMHEAGYKRSDGFDYG